MDNGLFDPALWCKVYTYRSERLENVMAMTIGQLAKAAGVKMTTIRFYLEALIGMGHPIINTGPFNENVRG